MGLGLGLGLGLRLRLGLGLGLGLRLGKVELLERGVASQPEGQSLGARVADAVPGEVEAEEAAAGG